MTNLEIIIIGIVGGIVGRPIGLALYKKVLKKSTRDKL
jgi:hypothetical protein